MVNGLEGGAIVSTAPQTVAATGVLALPSSVGSVADPYFGIEPLSAASRARAMTLGAAIALFATAACLALALLIVSGPFHTALGEIA